jgi:hypothetical protein
LADAAVALEHWDAAFVHLLVPKGIRRERPVRPVMSVQVTAEGISPVRLLHGLHTTLRAVGALPELSARRRRA